MAETLFYILGGGLVLVALALSAAGLRFESFPPSRGVLIAIATGIVALVGATATFAWINAEDEQSEHAAEHAAERAEAAEEAAAELQAAQGGEEAASEEAGEAPAPTETAAVDGAAVFESAGCSGCHTLAAAGSTAQTGPDLDGALKGKPASYIETAIVDPNAEVAEGFPPDVMPQNFGSTLSPEELSALVDYLMTSVRNPS